MVNKRNFFKALSAITLGTLTIGNFSNVWMMETTSDTDVNKKQKIEEYLAQQIADTINGGVENTSSEEVKYFSQCLARQIVDLTGNINEDTANSIALLARDEYESLKCPPYIADFKQRARNILDKSNINYDHSDQDNRNFNEKYIKSLDSLINSPGERSVVRLSLMIKRGIFRSINPNNVNEEIKVTIDTISSVLADSAMIYLNKSNSSVAELHQHTLDYVVKKILILLKKRFPDGYSNITISRDESSTCCVIYVIQDKSIYEQIRTLAIDSINSVADEGHLEDYEGKKINVISSKRGI